MPRTGYFNVEFDSRRAPCGLLVCECDKEGHDSGETVLVQVDYDYCGVASSMGWRPCHDGTDGTVDCKECGKKTGDMISEAYDFLVEHEGEVFEDPGYFQ